jgi:hypothetical protein
MLEYGVIARRTDEHGSEASATVQLPGGAQTFTLKAQNASGWGNFTTNTRTFMLAGPAQPLSAFGKITITLTSHDSIFETPDNWKAIGAGGSASIYSSSGNPLARLTGSAPSFTFHFRRDGSTCGRR